MSGSQQVGAKDTKVEKEREVKSQGSRSWRPSVYTGGRKKKEMLPKSDKKPVIGTKNPTSHGKDRHGRDGLVS